MANLFGKGSPGGFLLRLGREKLRAAILNRDTADIGDGFDIRHARMASAPLGRPGKLRLLREKRSQRLQAMRQIDKEIVFLGADIVPALPRFQRFTRNLARLMHRQFVDIGVVLKDNVLRGLRDDLDMPVFRF